MENQKFEDVSHDTLGAMARDNNEGDPVIGDTPDIEAPEGNVYTVIKGTTGAIALEAMGDLVIVVQDRYKSGFECKKCDGTGQSPLVCGWCKGTGVDPGSVERNEPSPCRKCYNTIHKGFEACPECNGRGGLLIAPEIAQRKPTTGTITSTGPDVKILRVGDRVLYGTFAGTELNFRQRNTVRVIHEHEIFCKIYGNMKPGEAR